MNIGDNTSVRELSTLLQAVWAPGTTRNILFLVVTSEENVVEATLRNSSEGTLKSWIFREIVELEHSLLDEASTLDLDDACEARRHEEEVELLVHLANFLSVTEFALKIVERLELAATRSIDMPFIFQPRIVVYRVWNFQVASEDDLCHEARKFDRLGILIFSTLVVETKSCDRNICIKVRKLIVFKLSGHHEDIISLLMQENLSI